MHLYTRIAMLMSLTLAASCNSNSDGISQEYEEHREGKRLKGLKPRQSSVTHKEILARLNILLGGGVPVSTQKATLVAHYKEEDVNPSSGIQSGEKSSATCTGSAFKCSDDTCISESSRCNGKKDCPDREDEAECKTCTGSAFKCGSHDKCIRESKRCDGDRWDCPGNEDEVKCTTCKGSTFKCGSDNSCIPRSRRCDGLDNCPDGEDEVECTSCTGYAFKCDSENRCIPEVWRCDGFWDCRDREDEAECRPCCIKEIANGSVIENGKKNGKRSRIPNSEDDFIFNGKDCRRETQHGNTIEYDCDEGYQLCGDKNLICRDGNWVDTENNRIKKLPTCEKPHEGAVYQGGDVIIMENGIFSSPKLPYNKNKYTAKVCTYRVYQIKLQIDMVIKNPTQGKCTEKLKIKSNKKKVTIPELCGNITDQTLYIDITSNIVPFEMIVVSLESSKERLSSSYWNISISFINSYKDEAPYGCLQYHRTPTGMLQSFNFNQVYTICIENPQQYRYSFSYCSILFNFTTFNVGKKNEAGDCRDDYLLIDKKWHCGNETNKIVEVKGIASYKYFPGYFIIVEVSMNNIDQEKGFSGTYTLKSYCIEPCTAEMDKYEGIHIEGNGGLFISPKQPNEMRRMSNKRTSQKKKHKHTAKLCPGALNVKQIELKVDMVINGLNENNKCIDRLKITDSQLVPLNLPVLCGIVTNQTFYIDIVDRPGPYEITVFIMEDGESSSESSSPMSDGELKQDELNTAPYWYISISFLTAPYKCQLYHNTSTGTLQSFNLEKDGYIICFAYILGYCDVEFNFTRFDLGTNCYTDYLFIGDEKYCGDKNNKVVKVDASGPITVGVKMDMNKGKGFFGTYRMIPCGKHSPTTVSNSSLVASVWELLVNPCGLDIWRKFCDFFMW